MEAESRFRALFDTAYPPLRRYAHHRGLRGSDADDLVAEVLTIAWRKLDDVPLDDPLPWLYAVARNVWRNGLRSRRRRAELLDRLPAPRDHDAEPVLDDGQGLATIAAALRALSDDDQEILRLVAWDELDTAGLATVLGCTPGAARVRLHRARKRLAATLPPVTAEDGATEPDERPRPEEVSDGRLAAP